MVIFAFVGIFLFSKLMSIVGFFFSFVTEGLLLLKLLLDEMELIFFADGSLGFLKGDFWLLRLTCDSVLRALDMP